ncbi:PilX N-terminal domain-containing pilus assembly protein [Stenotrophomonas sp. SY1]|uniref:pilus assembly PilX family protein n=1 Tax=Stenotrophomonas sp. SY1 TaxID=477235 RepID=UPI001E531A07|nr:PilX N-terminal domain-containing pilus assembly protein [Stenotrophomonas sp. SY1]MCD9086516.1 PilX N-terminal domain-containing pilus assembly protein [Stenotrophomonas sp. SY1]
MNRKSFRDAAFAPDRQQGMTLIVVLVLLIILSILGVAILRSTSMQERMSANMRDRSLAFQGAESAMRYAQEQVLAADVVWEGKVPVAADCTGSGICPTGATAVWMSLPTGSYDTRLAEAPQYWIEYLGIAPGYKGSCDLMPPSPDCESPMFRITARSQSLGRANVVLQANVSSRTPAE